MNDPEWIEFFSNIVRDIETGCWEWTGSLSWQYAKFGRLGVATRWLTKKLGRPLIKREQVDHLCRNTICVNPSHIEAVSQSTNIRRGDNFNSLKTHCKRGHEFTAENTYYGISSIGGPRRSCRVCYRLLRKQ